MQDKVTVTITGQDPTPGATSVSIADNVGGTANSLGTESKIIGSASLAADGTFSFTKTFTEASAPTSYYVSDTGGGYDYAFPDGQPTSNGMNITATATQTVTPVGSVSVTDSDPATITVSPVQTVSPFANLAITDDVPSEVLSATIAPNGLTVVGGSQTVQGTAAQLQSTLDALQVTAPPSGQGTISVQINDSTGAAVATENRTITTEQQVGTVTATDSDPTSVPLAAGATVTPFQHLTVSDSNPTETIGAIITPQSPSFAGAGYTVTNTGGFNQASPGGRLTLNGTAAQIQSAIDAVTLQTNNDGGGTIALEIFDGNGAAVYNSSFKATVPVTVPANGTVTAADTDPTNVSVNVGQKITPFAHATISDTVPTETISAHINIPNTYGSTGGVDYSGTAAQVQAKVDAFSAIKSNTSSGPQEFTLTVKDATGATAQTFTVQDAATVSHAPSPSQIAAIGVDVLKFYVDTKRGVSTSSDLSKLVTDYGNTQLTQASLDQVLTAALKLDAGNNAGTLANDIAGQNIGKLNSDAANGGSGLPNDLTSLVSETFKVGATYKGLASHESASTALAQTISQYHL